MESIIQAVIPAKAGIQLELIESHLGETVFRVAHHCGARLVYCYSNGFTMCHFERSEKSEYILMACEISPFGRYDNV
jgi:hypothetical protein